MLTKIFEEIRELKETISLSQAAENDIIKSMPVKTEAEMMEFSTALQDEKNFNAVVSINFLSFGLHA